MAGKRVTDPLESLAQRVAERVVDLLIEVLDVDALARRIDMNAVLDAVDIDGLLKRIDVPALLERVDVNDILRRVDMDTLVEETDLGAVIARSSGGVASEALDAARSQAVGLDLFLDRWVRRALRRKHSAPLAPRALLDGEADR